MDICCYDIAILAISLFILSFIFLKDYLKFFLFNYYSYYDYY